MPRDLFIKYNPNVKEVVVCVDSNSDCEVPKPTPFDGDAERARKAAAAAEAIAKATAAAVPATAPLSFMGGNSNYYFEKYMKYKAKYLQLQRNN
jgi:hypothetical protein